MERLSGLDASFLYLETPTLHMHVSMAAVFDPSTVRGGYSFERTHDLVAGRLMAAPVFRRRLVEVPFRLGHPYWIDDPAFDIDFHLRRAALPAPGGLAELADFVGDVCSRQLDRSKPLWQMYIVEGLENGNIALVTKMHHSTIDGVSGAELLAQLFDLDANPVTPEVDYVPAARGRVPSDVELVAQALATRLTSPPKIARLAYKTARALLDVRKVRGSESSGGKAALPLTAPRTSINAALTSHRKVSFSSISLNDVKSLKNKMGTTVNDVVLAICTGALRNYLEARDELPEVPLVATVPVSVQDLEGIQGSNRVSAMFVSLPTNVDDPLERLQTINSGTRGAKEEHNALGADVLLNWVEHATPNVFAAAARTYSRLKLADRHRPIHNLIISNVPGPDFPLYFSGAEMVAGFPLGPVMEGAGLNITVMSYRGVLNWGFMACRETVQGADELAAAVPLALDELLSAAGLPPGTAVGIAPGPRARGVATALVDGGAASRSRFTSTRTSASATAQAQAPRALKAARPSAAQAVGAVKAPKATKPASTTKPARATKAVKAVTAEAPVVTETPPVAPETPVEVVAESPTIEPRTVEVPVVETSPVEAVEALQAVEERATSTGSTAEHRPTGTDLVVEVMGDTGSETPSVSADPSEPAGLSEPEPAAPSETQARDVDLAESRRSWLGVQPRSQSPDTADELLEPPGGIPVSQHVSSRSANPFERNHPENSNGSGAPDPS